MTWDSVLVLRCLQRTGRSSEWVGMTLSVSMRGLGRYRVALRLRVVLSTELLVVSLVLRELGALQLDRGSVSVVPSVAHCNGRGLHRVLPPL